MVFSLRSRLSIFTGSLILLIGVVAWSAHLTWRLAYGVQTQVAALQGESLRLSDHFRSSVQSLNTSLLLYAINKDPSDREEFETEGRALQSWLGAQEDVLTTVTERELLRKMRVSVNVFLQKAGIYFSLRRDSTGDISLDGKLEELQESSEGLLALGFTLADAHRSRLDQVVTSMQDSVGHWQAITFGALALLVALAAWLASIIYREMISPLRVKLLESRAALEHQEKLASLGVLAAGVAHEIRNPLTAIKARLYTLRKSVDGDDDAIDDTTTIEQEISRLERIVRSFLQFARPPEPDLQPLTPDELLDEVAELLGPEWLKANVTITVGNRASASIDGDAQQLKQALINLVQNAAESMPQGGAVTLGSRVGTAILDGRSAAVVFLDVADNGPGMTPDVQARLFDPFFSTKPAGTGLGLALTARLIERHGGIVRCQTQVNRGTTFSLVLPRRIDGISPTTV